MPGRDQHRWCSRHRPCRAQSYGTPQLETAMRSLSSLLMMTWLAAGTAAAQQADLILVGARVWTADSALPAAEAVAIAGNRILRVGSRAEIMAQRSPTRRVIARDGGFVAPGFIDNHTHFNSAGALLLGANLLDVADAAV